MLMDTAFDSVRHLVELYYCGLPVLVSGFLQLLKEVQELLSNGSLAHAIDILLTPECLEVMYPSEHDLRALGSYFGLTSFSHSRLSEDELLLTRFCREYDWDMNRFSFAHPGFRQFRTPAEFSGGSITGQTGASPENVSESVPKAAGSSWNSSMLYINDSLVLYLRLSVGQHSLPYIVRTEALLVKLLCYLENPRVVSLIDKERMLAYLLRGVDSLLCDRVRNPNTNLVGYSGTGSAVALATGQPEPQVEPGEAGTQRRPISLSQSIICHPDFVLEDSYSLILIYRKLLCQCSSRAEVSAICSSLREFLMSTKNVINARLVVDVLYEFFSQDWMVPENFVRRLKEGTSDGRLPNLADSALSDKTARLFGFDCIGCSVEVLEDLLNSDYSCTPLIQEAVAMCLDLLMRSFWQKWGKDPLSKEDFAQTPAGDLDLLPLLTIYRLLFSRPVAPQTFSAKATLFAATSVLVPRLFGGEHVHDTALSPAHSQLLKAICSALSAFMGCLSSSTEYTPLDISESLDRVPFWRDPTPCFQGTETTFGLLGFSTPVMDYAITLPLGYREGTTLSQPGGSNPSSMRITSLASSAVVPGSGYYSMDYEFFVTKTFSNCVDMLLQFASKGNLSAISTSVFVAAILKQFLSSVRGVVHEVLVAGDCPIAYWRQRNLVLFLSRTLKTDLPAREAGNYLCEGHIARAKYCALAAANSSATCKFHVFVLQDAVLDLLRSARRVAGMEDFCLEFLAMVSHEMNCG